MRISCAHVLHTLAVNGSISGRLWAELFTGLPHHPRVKCDTHVTQFGQVWISSLVFARYECGHVSRVCVSAGAKRQREGCTRCRVINRKPPIVSMGCMWVVGGVLSLDHVLAMARLWSHQLRACAAHSGAECQCLGRPGGRVIHQFT